MLDLVVYSRDDLLFRLLGGETGDLLECLEMLDLDCLDLIAGVRTLLELFRELIVLAFEVLDLAVDLLFFETRTSSLESSLLRSLISFSASFLWRRISSPAAMRASFFLLSAARWPSSMIFFACSSALPISASPTFFLYVMPSTKPTGIHTTTETIILIITSNNV